MSLLSSLTTRWRRLPVVLLVGALAALLVVPAAGPAPAAQAQTSAANGLAWSLGGPGPDEARSVAADPDGNIYVTGVFTGTLDADPGSGERILTSTGDADIFLAKYAPDGPLLWAWSIGGPAADHAHAVAVDVSGRVYLAGDFTSVVDFEPGEAEASVDAGTQRNGFIAQYDADGVLIWVTPIGLDGDDEVLALAVDGAGNTVAAGLAGISATPGHPLTVLRGDLMTLRLDPNGRLLWSAVLPTATEGIAPVGIAAGPNGEVYLGASYTGTVRVALGPGLVDQTSAGGSDILVLKLLPSGALAWARNIGGPGNDTLGTGGLALDADGHVALTGAFEDRLDLNGDGSVVLESQGERDLLVASLDVAGAVRWANSFGGPDSDSGLRLTTDAARYVYVAGWFTGTPTTPPGLDDGLVTARGQDDAADGLLAKYTPDGRLAWARGFGGRGIGAGQSSMATAVSLDARGNALLAGRFFGTDVDFGADPGDAGPGTAILSSAGQSDAFVAVLGPDGSLVRR